MRVGCRSLAVASLVMVLIGVSFPAPVAAATQPQCYGFVDNTRNRVRLEGGSAVSLITQWEIQVRGLREDVDPGSYRIDFRYNVHYAWRGESLGEAASGEGSRDGRFFEFVDAPGSHQFVQDIYEVVLNLPDVSSARIVSVEFGDGYGGGVSCRRAN